MDRRSGKAKKHTTSHSSVLHHGFKYSRRHVVNLPANQQSERLLVQAQKRRDEIQALDQDDRDAVAAMDIDAGFSGDDVDAIGHIAPPGEEGFDISHEGGEFEVFEDLADGLAKSVGYKRVDNRDRFNRIETQTAHWELQLDRLVDAYLDFYMRCGDENMELAATDPDTAHNIYEIELLDTFSRRWHTLQSFPGDIYPNETFIRHGYIGCAPLEPTLGFSLRALAAFRQTHRTSPRFSVEAQCKTLCHIHNVPYYPSMAHQFTVAYDAYLAICRRIDHELADCLGHQGPNSRLLRSCPACFYKLENEPDLQFSCFVSVDGNNSLKRLGANVRGNRDRADSRNALSDRWLSVEEVDRFKDDVKSRSSVQTNPVDTDDWEDVDLDTLGGMKCVDRWRNAGPEERKKMFALFEESGIFIASCRHRVVLLVCDMIRSGELAKYPLAIIHRLINIVGDNIACAYDIGCAFATTINSSSIQALAKDNSLQMMVGAFHGHAHNRLCQLDWHPLYIKGAGRSEGEGCEHVFSSSNDLARGTRHATRFHRHQAIEEHFQFWDQDKYANLSLYLSNHYREATSMLRTLETELQIVQEQFGISSADFEQYHTAEKAYLKGLKNPSPSVTLKIEYVKVLNELSQCRKEWIDARAAANSVFTRVAGANIQAAIAQVHRRVDTAFHKLQNAETLVETIENTLSIVERWTDTSPEYKEFYQQNVLTNYTKALDELEKLVVMRLFELAKMSTSGTGYKLRRQIGKALQRRSEAIRNALNRYNTQAARLDPPRPALTWKEIVEYSFLGEFDLLRHSREDIRNEPWSQPARREATEKYYRLCRAKEEIARLNVEIRRLRTWIHDETIDMERALAALNESRPLLAAELKRRWVLRKAVNDVHLQRLNILESQRYYTGSLTSGVRLGSKRTAEDTEENSTPSNSHTQDGNVERNPLVLNVLENDNDDAGNEGDIELAQITEFVLTITD